MTNQLAKQTAGRLEVRSNLDSPYMPGFDTDDYAPPEYRVIQAMSKAHTRQELPMGQFYCEQTEDLREELDFIILRVQRNLTLWEKGDMNFPKCASDNRIIPKPGGKYGGPCGSCPARGKECFPGYNILALMWDNSLDMEDTHNLFLLRVNGTSVFPFRKLWAKVAQQYQNQPWKFVLKLTTEKKTNQSGTFFVMRPAIEYDLDGEEQKQAKIIADNFLGLDINAVDRDAQQQAAQQTVDRPAPKVVDSQAVQATKPRGITKGEAWQIVQRAKDLGVPETTIAGYIANTFQPKSKLGELHIGEWEMLNKWLEQEYGQAANTDDGLGELPF